MNKILKRTIILVFSVVTVALVLAVSRAGYAQSELPVEENTIDMYSPDLGPDSADMPLLEGGNPYAFPIVSYHPTRTDGTQSPSDLSIQVSYGDTQDYGQLGQPQAWVNIIGIVQGVTETTTLSYRLNGGLQYPLNIGPDQRRLYENGSFNIELAVADLQAGVNTVAIKALDNGAQVTKNVVVNYTPGLVWPTEYSIDWSSTGNILDVAQVVTGEWEIVGDELRTVSPGYDRLVEIGDPGWKDYEVTVPVTVESLNDTEWGPPSNGAGVGFIAAWQGHYLMEDEQPRLGWRKALGSLSWFSWSPNGTSGFGMLGYGGAKKLAGSTNQIMLNQTYMFKLSVQSNPIAGQPTTYRFKYWPQGTAEPALWTMQGSGLAGEPASGPLLLIAHQAMVRFGDVTVRPISSIPSSKIKKLAISNGQVVIEPDKASYIYGERVTVRALGDPGYRLASWGGNLSGDTNPLVFDITQDVTVKANFVVGADPTLTVTVDGNGSVNISPDKTKYQYGETVTLTPKPKAGFLFAGWSGDLTGVDNPATLVMNGDRTVSAKFIAANASSPVSDDFNSCLLNTSLWTFVNPVGDGTYELTGEKLILTVPAGLQHDIWLGGNRSARVMQPTANENFEIVARFDSVVNKRYQMQGILIEQDNKNFLRLEVHHDGASVEVYAAKFVGGTPELVISKFPVSGTPPWLRVGRTGDNWSYSFSYDGNEWFAAGSFKQAYAITSSGVFAGNQNITGSPPPEHKAVVDYFFNSLSPIVPEDGNTIGVDVTVQGNGKVTRDPDSSAYVCGQEVTLTATADPGWKFAGWSGALSGTENSKQITITGAMDVTATFTPTSGGGFKTYLPAVIK